MRNRAVALGDDSGQPRTRLVLLPFHRAGKFVEELRQLRAGFGTALEQADTPLPSRRHSRLVDQPLQLCVVDGLHQQPQPVDLAEDGRRVLTAGIDALHDLHDFGLDRRAQQDGLFLHFVEHGRIAQRHGQFALGD